MAFHAKSFWVDPSKAKEDNIKRNHKSGFTSFGPKTRSCYNCDDKRHFIAECPYENRELHNGRLIPKDKSKESKGKYSKAPNKKFYNNKTKKGKKPPRVVLVTREEYSSDEVVSSSDDEEGSSKEVAAIVTTNIPSSSLFESPNENPHIKNAHCFMATSSLDTSIVLSTQEEYSSGDDDVDDEEDATSNGLVALASLSTNSSSPSESPNEIIHVEEESCLMAKSSEVSSPSPSMPNISSDLGVDDASLKVKQEMLEFDEFMFNLQGIGQVARPCDPHRRATRRLCGPSLEGPGPAAALVIPGSTVLAVAARRWFLDANTFSHAGGTIFNNKSSTSTTSPSTSEMAESTPVKHEGLADDLKRKHNKAKAALETELVGSCGKTRSHGIKLDGDTRPLPGVHAVDLSHSIREPGFSFDANMAGFVIRHDADKRKAATLVAKRKTRPLHVTGPRRR
ncbi:hypothetical protein QYE76_044397 [Lolium multiflorum]|uniref:Uncharacterized protein n=1 Tax=Lolium multiflorum TaxID=4521 RepID=A0AAD8TKV8_LOLMU|nr:hypothetical protein QYE76_044397 [Lolium multiflorum]